MSGIWLITYLVLWIFVTIEGFIIIALLRGFTGLHQRIEVQQESQGVVQLSPGDMLADHDLTGLSGDMITLSRQWQKGTLLLLFVSVDCVPCRTLLTWVGNAFRNDRLSDWNICVLCAGHEAKVINLVERTGLPLEIPVAVVEHGSLKGRYHISQTPTVAIVEENGHVFDVVVGEATLYLEILIRRSEFQIQV